MLRNEKLLKTKQFNNVNENLAYYKAKIIIALMIETAALKWCYE